MDEIIDKRLPQDQTIEWQDEEYTYHEKGPNWFWFYGIIVAIFILGVFLLQYFLLAFILLIGSIMLGYYANRYPDEIIFGLEQTGIRFGTDLFPYTTIKSFWVDFKIEKLILQSDRLFIPHIVIPLRKTNPNEIRERLLTVLPEERHNESLVDITTDYFGF